MLRWIVTGTGRCGTGYIVRVLASAGVPSCHEGVFNLNGEGFARAAIEESKQPGMWEVDSSWLAAPYLGTELTEGLRVVHLVRHPCDVIRSFLRMGFWMSPTYSGYRAFKIRYLPNLEEFESKVVRAGYYYVHWNRMVEPHAEHRHRVEDDVRELLDYMGVDYEGKRLYPNTRYNSRILFPFEFKLDMLPTGLRDEVVAMGERYGYDMKGR